eukprot:CAMPEP_0201101000 /NCGR_PEP_ID=MMETSP0812-20130820/9809_1 /ASSEMBLY_ACC=CAM_ASM_000668 /TAXON_ID=98059 /ORGANISM="Dinobryon sp., Strain UTEXLB2267" /LENGTH=737 /DNA_ID=CAMNT_0047357619 /DNA_START=21 /DNA_END=2231 /DNA_ORIENTATION=-
MNGSSLIRPGGKSYALTGEQSNKESTTRTRNSGLKQFNTFLKTKNVDIQFGARNPVADEKYQTPELEKFFCDKRFWQEFGTFIKQDATPQSNNRDDNMFYPGTVYNYFGMAKERIRLIYPAFVNNSIWPGHEWNHGGDQTDGWFSKIRDDVKKYVEDVRLKAGKTNKKVTLPIGRKVTSECVSFFLGQNTVVGVEKTIAIAMTFHAIGRAGEAGWVLYDTAHWNTIENNLYVLWCEPKTSQQYLMCFHPDSSTFTLDVFFLFFLYMLVGGGVSYTLFPSYEKEKEKRKLVGTLLFPFLISGAADKVTSYMDECVGEVPSLKDNEPCIVSAKSLRKGSLQECAKKNVRDAGEYRGHWAETTQSSNSKNSDIYMEGCDELLNIAGLALSGYDDPRVNVNAPTCEAILQTMKEDERQKFNNFLSNLLSGPYDISSKQSHLQPLSYHMFASFLRWYQPFTEQYSWNHCTFDKLKAEMFTFDYTWEHLNEWSELVRRDFLAQNGKIFGCKAINDSDDVLRDSIYAPQILGTMLKITNQQTILKKAIEELTKQFQRLDRKISDIQENARFSSPKRPTPMDSHGSPTTTASSGSTYNKCCSSTTSASFNTSIEQEVSNHNNQKNGSEVEETHFKSSSVPMNVEEVLHQNVNNVLMNPIKKPRKTYSVNITDIDQKVVERGFITEYYDCGFHYAIDPNIASHKAKPSKINAVFKDINAKIKHICHPKVMDRPSDELNPLHNIPVW